MPFALVGSIWLMWLLGYHVSTASWVGIIALVGLAAETGIVMIVYLDAAFERRLRVPRCIGGSIAGLRRFGGGRTGLA